MQSPSKADYQSVRNYFEYDGPLVEAETIHHRFRDDIVSLGIAEESGQVRAFVESRLVSLDRFLQNRCHINIIKVRLKGHALQKHLC